MADTPPPPPESEPELPPEQTPPPAPEPEPIAPVQAPPPAPPPPIMQAAPPPAAPFKLDWRILVAIGAALIVAIIAGVTLYTNQHPVGALLPGQEETTTAVEDEEWPGLSEHDRLHVRPERIGRPVMSAGMAMTILSGYADIEFTVGADGRATDVRVERESVRDIGYGAEGVRLVRGAAWPTEWRGRVAPFPARYRVIFPPGRAGREIAPLAIASVNLTPEILALRRNANVTMLVRVSPEGLVESARVIDSDVESSAVNGEAMRVAMSARYPPNPAPYETSLVVRFDVLGATGQSDDTPVGPVVALSEVPFAQRPSAGDFARHYPRRALAAGISGRVTLDCIVRSNYRLNCVVAGEDPPGAGFGQAALRLSRQFRAGRQFPDGRNTVGAQVSMPMVFQVE